MFTIFQDKASQRGSPWTTKINLMKLTSFPSILTWAIEKCFQFFSVQKTEIFFILTTVSVFFRRFLDELQFQKFLALPRFLLDMYAAEPRERRETKTMNDSNLSSHGTQQNKRRGYIIAEKLKKKTIRHKN